MGYRRTVFTFNEDDHHVLTQREVQEIIEAKKRRYELREELQNLSDRALALKYNVSKSTIGRIT